MTTETEPPVVGTDLPEEMARLAHDVGTPLTSIIGYVELLAEEGLSDRQLEYLAVIRRNSARLDQLVGELQSICARCSLPE